MSKIHRSTLAHQFHVAAPIDKVFGLFDPITEQDWVPGWNPIPVHPDTLSLEATSVFFLDREHGREIWTVLRHDPVTHVAEYLATTPEHQQRWITVNCHPETNGTRVDVEYRVTALSEQGRDALETLGNDFIRGWEAPVNAALGIAS